MMAPHRCGSLKIESEHSDGVVTVRAVGDIDEDERMLFRRHLSEAIATGCGEIDIDLSQVRLLTAAGIAEIVRADACASTRGQTLRIASYSVIAGRVLDLTGLITTRELVEGEPCHRLVGKGSGYVEV